MTTVQLYKFTQMLLYEILDAPTLTALRKIEDNTAADTLQKVVHQIADDFEAGATLSEAMAKHPDHFNSMYVWMIRSGEVSGCMEIALDRLSIYLNHLIRIETEILNISLSTWASTFATMLAAGVPIISALEVLEKSTDHPRFQAMTRDIVEAIKDGRRLSSVYSKYADVLPSWKADLLEEAEKDGSLPMALSNIGGFSVKKPNDGLNDGLTKLAWSLREKTGRGLLDCRTAVREAKGDLAAAEAILKRREYGIIWKPNNPNNPNDSLWSQDSPKESGAWWWWSGDKECAPIHVEVMYSGFSNNYFLAAGQWGWAEPQPCDKIGGWWMRLPEPQIPGLLRKGDLPRDEIKAAINRHSAENGSNTPDFILAEYLTDCLEVWDRTVRAREKWYGREPKVVDAPAGAPTCATTSPPCEVCGIVGCRDLH